MERTDGIPFEQYLSKYVFKTNLFIIFGTDSKRVCQSWIYTKQQV